MKKMIRIGNKSGDFSVKTAWEIVRKKKTKEKLMDKIWNKRLPFKLNFFIWRAWKARVATDGTLKRMRIHIISRCWCCETQQIKIMSQLFLIAPIAHKLWKVIASIAGIHMNERNLKQNYKFWWFVEKNNRLQYVYRGILTIIMWTLWRRRNIIRHRGIVNFSGLKQ